jgi:hypothetical protein
MSDTSSPGGDELRAIEDALPEDSGRLNRIAERALKDATGPAFKDLPKLKISWAPGRIGVSLGELSYLAAVGEGLDSLEEAIITACYALAVAARSDWSS